MFLGFLQELRRRKVPVGVHEAVALGAALRAGLHHSSLEGFYFVARALWVHSEAHLDAFDQAFAHHFQGVEDAALELTSELLQWLRDAQGRPRPLTEEERALLQQLSLSELEEQLRRRLAEQRARHDGGARWIGTGGTSPFGHGGAARPGIRVGGEGGNRSAVRVAQERRFRAYRGDLVLDVRQLQVALGKLRAFAREGVRTELDEQATIDATARNAGELELVLRPQRRPTTRVLLLMDVGGSMDPHAQLVSRLFSAATRASHFKELRAHYFHNAIYGQVYLGPGLQQALPLEQLVRECGKDYRLVLVGDALMAPYELFEPASAPEEARARGALRSFSLLRDHFSRSAWLNPEPLHAWSHPTVAALGRVFEMFPLTLEGLTDAVAHLTRVTAARAASGR